MLRPIITFLALACGLVSAQRSQKLPSSFPHDYPGKPSGAFGPEWQKYFEVTDQLPNVTFPFARNFAGNIPVDRPNHPNNTLFFWAFEKENGSLTANAGESNEPWGLWLNGGPGSSSLIAALFENGLLQIQNDYTIAANNWSWNQLADYVWIDQPVGVGFSTVDSDGYVKDEDQMATDFFGFLANLVKVFPSLQTRPLYITGESYAGTYIPYLVKAYFGMTNPPVKLAKFVIGDGTLNTDAVGENLPALSVIETYPQLIGYDPEVYGYFKEQSQLCGYDLNLTYPQNGHFPNLTPPGLPDGNSADSRFSSSTRLRSKQALLSEAKARLSDEPQSVSKEKRDSWLQEKRDLSGRPNGTIDTFYGCFLWAEMMDYALNFSLPWVNISNVDLLQGLDLYDLPDGLNPETVRSQSDAAFFLNDNRTRTALHAPTSKNWVMSIRYPFGNVQGSADPSLRPMAFFDELAANATKNNVSVVIYSGNDDSLVPHRGSEVTIQNTTFGGIQGFSRKPSTVWTNDRGEFAGIVHQERNWTFVLFTGAGHLVPQSQPENAFVFLREFVLGNNQTGFFDGSNSVVGGENTSIFANNLMPGQSGIALGSGTTQSTFFYPSATLAAWESFTQTAIPTQSGGSAAANNNGAQNVMTWSWTERIIGLWSALWLALVTIL